MAKAKKTDEIKDGIKDIEVAKEAKEDVKEKPKTKRQLTQELRKLRDGIDIEILNISTGGCKYVDRNENPYFDLVSGESKTISLGEIQEVCNKAKKFFTEYELVVIDVYNDDYSLEDILVFLGLDRIYQDIENFDSDYIEDILINTDDYEFEKIINIKDKNFVKALASKSIYLNSLDQYEISRKKENIIKSKLKLEVLFPE